MDKHELRTRMWSDLVIGETAADAETDRVTERALLYLATGGLELADVLDALKISRASWYRRAQAYEERRAANIDAADAAARADRAS